MDKKYLILTFGCQMNVHESEKLAGILEQNGYTACDNAVDADIVVFNTCAIRENAEQKIFGNLGELKNIKIAKPDTIIAIGGCMSQQNGVAEDIMKRFPFVDIVFGTHNLADFERFLIERKTKGKRICEITDDEKIALRDNLNIARTSGVNAWVNIMYGCNNFCTYCIVPYVRGRERSRKLNDILDECKELINDGYKEITLLGQNVNSYGNDFSDENINFATLINEISKLDGKFRLRFMTNHPKDLKEDLIKAIANSDKTCKSIHLPVQAGANNILKLMNRKYTREDYLAKVKLLRDYIPDISITTDIMVGFPNETEDDFLDTINLVKEVNYAGAFTFIYSKREGTPAAKMDCQIDEEVSKRRIMELIELQNSINREQSKVYLNKTIEILCEGYDDKKEMYLGRDTYGRMAYFKSEKDIVGEFVNVKISKTGGISLIGEIVSI